MPWIVRMRIRFTGEGSPVRKLGLSIERDDAWRCRECLVPVELIQVLPADGERSVGGRLMCPSCNRWREAIAMHEEEPGYVR